MRRTILHCDVNSFFAAVECASDPKLKYKPLVVAGNPENRKGVIISRNQVAFNYKISTGDTIWEAKKKCPSLVVVRPQHEKYKEYSLLLNEIYARFTDQVEPYGLDESWLDVTNVQRLFGDGKTIANKIRKIVKEELCLTVSVGVSFNKIFAKLGSDYKKPDATTIIARECYKEIVYPLPVNTLMYVGKATNITLKELKIYTIGELAKSDPYILELYLGKLGATIWRYANGLDNELVRYTYLPKSIKSIGKGMTFKRNLLGKEDIYVGVYVLVSAVTYRLRGLKLKCKSVAVSIKNKNFHSIVRQINLERPTYLAKVLCDAIMGVIMGEWSLKQPIRALTVTTTQFFAEDQMLEQLSFFSDIDEFALDLDKQENIEQAIYNLRVKYGVKILLPASVIYNYKNLGIFDS